MDIMRAVGLLENAIKTMSEYRNAFEEAKITTQTLVTKWGGRAHIRSSSLLKCQNKES
ncbi:Hypothetical protein FKW44_013781 [Caligus rogercresseyi]|uniref:Uncharacterized protein n=1 Tax=Caligus rogercresseyi TaxID=217165 RepID=A0A7T8GXZ2_CALRO|nr:Hypothetical protein FKW44_013781 [Caligus rogercresseyi]